MVPLLFVQSLKPPAQLAAAVSCARSKKFLARPQIYNTAVSALVYSLARETISAQRKVEEGIAEQGVMRNSGNFGRDKSSSDWNRY